jgi:hypothetical protein
MYAYADRFATHCIRAHNIKIKAPSKEWTGRQSLAVTGQVRAVYLGDRGPPVSYQVFRCLHAVARRPRGMHATCTFAVTEYGGIAGTPHPTLEPPLRTPTSCMHAWSAGASCTRRVAANWTRHVICACCYMRHGLRPGRPCDTTKFSCKLGLKATAADICGCMHTGTTPIRSACTSTRPPSQLTRGVLRHVAAQTARCACWQARRQSQP